MAALTGLSKSTIYEYARAGSIPAIQVAKSKFLFPRAAVDDWLAMPGWRLANVLRQIDSPDRAAELSPEAQAQIRYNLSRVRALLEDVEGRLDPDTAVSLRVVK